MITFNRTANGYFEVLKDGQPTKFYIFNACAGASGRGNNTYGISNKENGKITLVGSLQKTKKTVTVWLKD